VPSGLGLPQRKFSAVPESHETVLQSPRVGQHASDASELADECRKSLRVWEGS
jgi:hypothetical protein